MPLLGRVSQALGQERQLLDFDGHLAGLALDDGAACACEVAGIERVVDRVLGLVHVARVQHELQATRIVLDVDEDEVAAQLAEDVEPTRDAHALALQLVELARDLLGLMRPLERGRVGAHAGGLETVELGQARRADTIGLLRAVTTLGHNGVQASSRLR